MIAPLTTLLAAAVSTGVVVHSSKVVEFDPPGLPMLVAGRRGLDRFQFSENGSILRADGFADLYLVTRLLGPDGKPDEVAATEADVALGALLDLLPSYGFAPVRTTQDEAHWGSHEVIVCEVRVTRADAVRAAPATT